MHERNLNTPLRLRGARSSGALCLMAGLCRCRSVEARCGVDCRGWGPDWPSPEAVEELLHLGEVPFVHLHQGAPVPFVNRHMRAQIVEEQLVNDLLHCFACVEGAGELGQEESPNETARMVPRRRSAAYAERAIGGLNVI